MSSLQALRKCEDRKDLATILGYSLKQFTAIIYAQSPQYKYNSFTIPKKTGGNRNILAPKSDLKQLQQKLATLLSKCYEEIECNRLTKLPKPVSILSFSSHGFRRKIDNKLSSDKFNFDIYSNAKSHTNKKYVLNLDIKDFFKSITFSRIVGYFVKNRDFLLDVDVSVTIAQIATYRETDSTEGYLPQGSPLSPIISNFIGSVLDIKILRLAKKYKLDYTRYADDITLSTNLKDFPYQIAVHRQDRWIVGLQLEKIIKSSGFEVNKSKTRLYTNNERQEVTSLSVNKKVNIRKEYYRYTRSMVNQYCMTGMYFKSSEHRRANIANDNSLNGILSFIYYIKRDRNLVVDDGYIKYCDMKGLQKLYTKFLFHYNFIYQSRTTVIGEGFTDPRHLRIAYKVIYNAHNTSIKFTYLGNTKRFSHFTGMKGGTGLINKFLSEYQLIDKSIAISKFPCIILLDGDKAGNDVIKMAEKLFNKTIRKINIPKVGIMLFYHVYNNLYILQLDKDVDVEKLYDSNVLQTKVDQRTFNPSNKKTDQTKFYGKKEFLEKVIEPNRSSINFSNFEIVFKTLNHIQLYHLIAYRSEAGLAAKTNLSLISAKSSNTT
ncbi:retron Ec67 family RNA-directed DNA polymerase/endonuclease [Psychrobacter submarinus]|uniref:retron Ec67 family RNA-directed DNA polymerase/endonuclease n=1 Tax=Psychrobacter submarinus TaxID=154108 RepID=UPI00191894C6|nr:retron Ec67 family RNA-directed DNA polymerase/endonuclease [Psychrobacter submarinus]